MRRRRAWTGRRPSRPTATGWRRRAPIWATTRHRRSLRPLSRVAETVVIRRRFRGPPDSGQGGYSCGLVAERIDSDCATVTLRKPPPLERPLTVDDARLLDGDVLIAEGVADALDVQVPEAVSLEVAQHGSAHPFWGQFVHPFPG